MSCFQLGQVILRMGLTPELLPITLFRIAVAEFQPSRGRSSTQPTPFAVPLGLRFTAPDRYTGAMERSFFMVLVITALAGCASRPPAIDRVEPDLRAVEATDLNGRSCRPLASSGSIATVLIFITTDCPIANGYAPEINSIVREYGGSGVDFYLVHVDHAVRLDAARRHAAEYSLNAAVLMDTDQRLSRAVGATITPEAAVVGPDGAVLYRGRIDDRVTDYGKKRVAPSQRDLREALDAVIAGRAVATPRTAAVGCFMPKIS